ncbi:unnamed protein product [Phyllotreta striolata]|uniref:PHD finger protein 20 n=1 Tax=Phyllotreta striolata TaxID=444603 RepID=A0A9N9TMV4_PHYSR|nr:unnamed protein product [Phyllotreta striolata]
MGRKCNVEGCQSDSSRPKDVGVTFHKVPPHSDIRPKWLSLCRIPEDKKSVKVIYVCSRHFLRADFCNFKGKKYMLKQGVLPSVFPWDKSKLEAIKAETKKDKQSDSKDESGNSSQIVTDLDTSIDIKEENLEDKIKQEVLEGDDQLSELKVEPKNEEDIKEETPNTSTTNSLNFTINSKLEVLDFKNKWYPAKIVEIDYEENEVLIHFDNFSTKYDEWISTNSSRLRPLQEGTPAVDPEKNLDGNDAFAVGERCLASWSVSRKFPATITKVLDNDNYEVLFDDGFVKTLKGSKINKSDGKSSSLFDPIKSTKQDRRDKKRKLNVAALFRKRPKLDLVDDKSKKANTSTASTSDAAESPQTDGISPGLTPSADDIDNWKPSWYKNKPIGIESSLQTQDGLKVTYIVPDPRLPPGWNKHLIRRTKGCDPGKWDTIIISPDNKRLRSKSDALKYIEDHPNEVLNEKMFDFSLVLKRKRKTATSTPMKSPPKEPQPSNLAEFEENLEASTDSQIREEDNSNCLKILFEDDAYKCPISGCGKIFRRENLAQMHVKHYHPEYTKFLDSTPNVADLAYARTVGESLDRSPEEYDLKTDGHFLRPQKPPPLKPALKTILKTPKHSSSALEEMPELKPAGKPKSKDSEIIKLLNTKPYNKQESEGVQSPPATGTPASPYPDIKLKDLLTRTDTVPKRDDLNMKNLCKTKPAGIKTLLPGHRPPSEPLSEYEDFPKPPKRKRGHLDSTETIQGRDHQTDQQNQSTPNPTLPVTAPPSHNLPTTPHDPSPATQSPITQPPAPHHPPNNIIIEGGEVIKIVRMKQEEIINCTCGFMEEDGLMIQCELCLCWQHAYCNNIERESQVPDKYVCYICQNPLRERRSRKYYHDQDWLTKGAMPVGGFHTKDDEALHKRFEKLKKCHDLSGRLVDLAQYQHSLGIKMKIAEAKNHPKLYLWSKPWPKLALPEKTKPELEDIKPKIEGDGSDFLKSDFDDEKESQNENSMLMMILKAGKSVMPKLDLNTLMENNSPIIPQPEAVIDSADCRLNLLEHLVHQHSLVDERLDDFEKQLDILEAGFNIESGSEYPRTRHTMQMLMRDLDTLKDFSHCSGV